MKCFLYVLSLLCLWQGASSFQVRVSHRAQTTISQSSSVTSSNSVTKVRLSPGYLEGVLVSSSTRDQLWTMFTDTRDACAEECPIGSPDGCQFVQFDQWRHLCTGFGAHAVVKFTYRENFATYTPFINTATRYPGMTFGGTELTYDGTSLTELLEIDWTEQACTDVCHIHPRCGVAIFNTRTATCTLKQLESRSLPTPNASLVSVAMDSVSPDRRIPYMLAR